MDRMRSLIKSQPGHQVSACTALLTQLKYFAGNQIRNTACVGGNIVTGSPISDSCPLYMACGATFVLQEEGNPQRSVLAEDFFLGYRSALLHCNGLLVCAFSCCYHGIVRVFRWAVTWPLLLLQQYMPGYILATVCCCRPLDLTAVQLLQGLSCAYLAHHELESIE